CSSSREVNRMTRIRVGLSQWTMLGVCAALIASAACGSKAATGGQGGAGVCSTDQDCKGDRVCHGRACVDPTPGPRSSSSSSSSSSSHASSSAATGPDQCIPTSSPCDGNNADQCCNYKMGTGLCAGPSNGQAYCSDFCTGDAQCQSGCCVQLTNSG